MIILVVRALLLIILSPILLLIIILGILLAILFGLPLVITWAINGKIDDDTGIACFQDAISQITLWKYKPVYPWEKKYQVQ